MEVFTTNLAFLSKVSSPAILYYRRFAGMKSVTMKRRVILALGLAGLLFLAKWPPDALASGDKLNFAYSAVAGAQAIPWVTKEAGLFEKHNLDLQMIYIDGGPRATQSLLAGEIPIMQLGGSAPVAARLRGGDILTIGGLVNALAYSLIVHPDIQRPEHLKGKSLAVSRLGSISDYATRKILMGTSTRSRCFGAANSRRFSRPACRRAKRPGGRYGRATTAHHDGAKI